jgi:anti-anti-sigma factor
MLLLRPRARESRPREAQNLTGVTLPAHSPILYRSAVRPRARQTEILYCQGNGERTGMETLRAVQFSGALDMSNLADTQHALSTIDGPCVLDLDGVTFLDSTAITAFVEFARRVGPRNVRVRGATFQFRRILELVGLTHLFDIIEERDG